jgi:hypothetical protein
MVMAATRKRGALLLAERDHGEGATPVGHRKKGGISQDFDSSCRIHYTGV